MAENKSYSEKLRDPRWQKKRLEILQRDNFTCVYCGDTKNTLHIHHEMYIGKNPWDTPNECLNTACEDCHEFWHIKFSPLEKYLIECVFHRDGKEDFDGLKKTVKNIRDGK